MTGMKKFIAYEKNLEASEMNMGEKSPFNREMDSLNEMLKDKLLNYAAKVVYNEDDESVITGENI